jgi:hypothetical protein
MFISNLSKGGQFAKVSEQDGTEITGRQVTKYLLCDECEGRLSDAETSVSQILRKMENNPTGSHRYDKRFLRFVTSISWRVMQFKLDHLNRGILEHQFPACKYWRHYLRGIRNDVAGYSQHAFLVFDPKTEMHRILRGDIHPEQNLVISQAGPLLIVGRLSKDRQNKADADIWAKTEVNRSSGVLTHLHEWRVGDNITKGLAALLLQNQRRMITAAKRNAESSNVDRY